MTPQEMDASDEVRATSLASPPNDQVPPAKGHLTVGDTVALLRSRYPESTAESWDRVGLVVGDVDAPVSRVHYTVDPTIEVIQEALDLGADLIIAHHPLLLRGVHSVSTESFKGRAVHELIRGECALYVAHTNADKAYPGVNDALAHCLGLDDLTPLVPDLGPQLDKHVVFAPREDTQCLIDALAEAGAGSLGEYSRCAFTHDGEGTFEPSTDANPTIGQPGIRETVRESRIEMIAPRHLRTRVVTAMRQAHPYEEPAFDVLPMASLPGETGLGRVGSLPAEMTLQGFADQVAKALPHTAQGIRVAGDPGASVRRVAVCGGSGDSLFDQVRASGADVYVTADLRHHPAAEAREHCGFGAPYLVDVAHWASEWPWLHNVANWLDGELNSRGHEVPFHISTHPTDPWTFRVPSQGGLVR